MGKQVGFVNKENQGEKLNLDTLEVQGYTTTSAHNSDGCKISGRSSVIGSSGANSYDSTVFNGLCLQWIMNQGKTGVVACLGLKSSTPTGTGKLARRES